MGAEGDKKLDQIVKVLKAEFKPSRLFLFGSRANGTARSDSDYDFVLVVPGNRKSRIDNMARARHLLHQKCNISADVFIYSKQEFDEWKNELSSIPETAMNTGKEFDLG